MKNKIFTITVLFLFFLGLGLFLSQSEKKDLHKILKVIEADKFYIDINNNGEIDEHELFGIKDISAFKPIKDKYSIEDSKRLKISLADYLKIGFLARNWAREEFQGKLVYVKPGYNCTKNNKICFADIEYENKNLAIILLKNGLAYSNKAIKTPYYFYIQNKNQMKYNASEISHLEFVFLNTYSNVIHKLNCDYAKLSQGGELILKSRFNARIHHKCRFCFEKNKTEEELEFKIPKSKGTYKKSINKKFNNIELLLINPLEYKKPDMYRETPYSKRLIEEINASKISIDMALYGIGEQPKIIEALKNARSRGVKIRAVVDYSKKMDKIYPGTKDFIEEFDAKTDKTETLMHNKFFIFDDKKVLSGSVNISSSGSSGYNSNSAVLIDSSDIALAYKEEFEQMYSLKFSKKKKAHTHSKVSVGDSFVTPYFSPKNNVLENLILPTIKSAKQEIFISIFCLTDNTLIDELISAKKRGIEVLILEDALCAMNFKDKLNTLRSASIPVIVENWGGKNHEKTVVVDSKKIIIGSSNYSKSGFNKNDENMLLIENPSMASFYRDYYLYLFNSIDKKFLKYIPRAEGLDSINSCSDGIDNNFDGKIDMEDAGCAPFRVKK